MHMEEIETTPSSIKQMLDAVQKDRDGKRVFLAMPREEQLLAILGLISYLSSQIANLQKDSIEYRGKRELQEQSHGQRLIDTGEKIAEGINNALSVKFGRWQRLADSILDKVITIVILGVLYLVFGGKLP